MIPVMTTKELERIEKTRQTFDGQISVKDVKKLMDTIHSLHHVLTVAAKYVPEVAEVTEKDYVENYTTVLQEASLVHGTLEKMK